MADFYGQKYYTSFCDKLGQNVQLQIMQKNWGLTDNIIYYPTDFVGEYLFANNLYDSSLIYPFVPLLEYNTYGAFRAFNFENNITSTDGVVTWTEALGPAEYENGVVGQALYMDGTNVPFPFIYDGCTAYTEASHAISLWIKIQDPSGEFIPDNEYLIFHDNIITLEMFNLDLSVNEWIVRTRTAFITEPSSNTACDISVPLSIHNQWAHLVVNNYDNQTDVWVNGIYEDSSECFTWPAKGYVEEYIVGPVARFGAGSYLSFDQVRVFDGSITSATIADLYNDKGIDISLGFRFNENLVSTDGTQILAEGKLDGVDVSSDYVQGIEGLAYRVQCVSAGFQAWDFDGAYLNNAQISYDNSINHAYSIWIKYEDPVNPDATGYTIPKNPIYLYDGRICTMIGILTPDTDSSIYSIGINTTGEFFQSPIDWNFTISDNLGNKDQVIENQWTHIAVNCYDGVADVWVNGSLTNIAQDPFIISGDPFVGDISIYIPRAAFKSDTTYVDIDSYYIFDASLSTQEIQILYNEPSTGFIGGGVGDLAYSLNGPQDYEMTISTALDTCIGYFDFTTPGSGFSESFWYKSLETDCSLLNIEGTIVSHINSNGEIVMQGGDPSAEIYTSTAIVNDGSWNHIVLGMNEESPGNYTSIIYINNIGDVSISETNTGFGAATGSLIMGDPDDVTISLARLRSYNRLINGNEINELYNEESPSPLGSTHFWPLDNNLFDSSINPVNLEVSIGTETYVTDGDKTAFSFDGSTGLTSKSNVNESLSQGAYSFWIKTTDANSVIFYNGEGMSISDKSAEMSLSSNGKIIFKVSYDLTADEDSITSTYPINDGEWHHVSGYYEVNSPVSEMGLFIDGGFDVSIGGVHTQVRTDNGPLHIGFDASGNNWFTGYIDNFRIYRENLDWIRYLALYANPVSAASEPLKLLQPGIVLDVPNRDTFEPVRGAGVKIYVKEPSLLYYDDLFNTSPHDNKVIITVDGDIRFQGFVAPEVYENAYNSPFNHALIIPANDGLGGLDNYTPSFQSENFTSLIKVVARLLEDTGLEQDIWINSRLFSEDMAEDSSAWNLFDQTLLEKYAFLRSNEDSFSSRKLLENILKPFSCLIYQEDDHWKIDRNLDIFYSDASTVIQTVQKYDSNGDSLGWFIIDKGKVILDKILDGTQSLRKISGHNKVKLSYDTIKYSNLIDVPAVADTSVSTPIGIVNNPGLWKWESNVSVYDVELFDIQTIYFLVNTGTWEPFDGLTTELRFSFDPDSVNHSSDTADTVNISFEGQGQYFAVFSDPNKRQSAAIEMRIFNDSNPGGFWITQDASGEYQHSSIRADVSIGFDYDDNGAYLTNWGYADYDFKINLYHLRSYLDTSTNEMRLTFQPMKNTALSEHSWTYIKNPKVKMDFNDTQNNIVEADVDNDFLSLYKDDIYYSDVINLNYYNGFETSIGRTNGWYDQDPSIYTLQEKFILDRLALYNSPRYTYTIEMKDASLRTVGDVYYDTYLSENLVPLGLKYNFRDNVIKLNMVQYATPEALDVSIGGRRIITDNEWNQNYKDSR